jgi:hypothetical protein
MLSIVQQIIIKEDYVAMSDEKRCNGFAAGLIGSYECGKN